MAAQTQADRFYSLAARVTQLIMPASLTKSLLSRCLQHPHWLVRSASLQLISALLHRFQHIVTTQLTSVSPEAGKLRLQICSNYMLQRLPDIQVLMALRTGIEKGFSQSLQVARAKISSSEQADSGTTDAMIDSDSDSGPQSMMLNFAGASQISADLECPESGCETAEDGNSDNIPEANPNEQEFSAEADVECWSMVYSRLLLAIETYNEVIPFVFVEARLNLWKLLLTPQLTAMLTPVSLQLLAKTLAAREASYSFTFEDINASVAEDGDARVNSKCRFGLLLRCLSALLNMPATTNSSSSALLFPDEACSATLPGNSGSAKLALRASPAVLPLEAFEGATSVGSSLYSLLIQQGKQLAASLAACRFELSPVQSASYSHRISLQFNIILHSLVKWTVGCEADSNLSSQYQNSADLACSPLKQKISPEFLCDIIESTLCEAFSISKIESSQAAKLRRTASASALQAPTTDMHTTESAAPPEDNGFAASHRIFSPFCFYFFRVCK